MNIKKLLSLFNLRVIEKELFVKLFYGGPMSASKLAKSAGISRTSVYDILKNLINTGLVIESLKSGIKIFNIQPLEKIQLLLEEKEVGLAKKEFENIKKEYTGKNKSITPQLQLFEGKIALRQMMKDMLLYRDMEVIVLWPIKKIISLLGTDFLENFHKERIARNINLKVIWPKTQIPSIKKHPFLKVGDALKREARIAPPEVDFSLGYAIYGQTVRFISSSKENFGFLVESEELSEMMKSQFKIIWNNSQPLRFKEKPVDHSDNQHLDQSGNRGIK